MEDEERKEGEGRMDEEKKEQQQGIGEQAGQFREEAKKTMTGEFMPEDPVNSYINVWKSVILAPVDFFKEMPKSGGYGNPTIFALINFLIYGIGFTLITLGKGFVGIVVTPVFGVIGLFIGAAVLWVCAKIVGGEGDYEGTYRVISYVTATYVVYWIPVAGWLVGFYGLYLMVVGLAEAHRLSQGKALVAVLIPVVIFTAIAIVAALAIGSFIAGIVPRGGIPR